MVATEVDHIQPLSRGGGHGWDNLQALCKSCHSKQTARESGFARGKGDQIPGASSPETATEALNTRAQDRHGGASHAMMTACAIRFARRSV